MRATSSIVRSPPRRLRKYVIGEFRLSIEHIGLPTIAASAEQPSRPITDLFETIRRLLFLEFPLERNVRNFEFALDIIASSYSFNLDTIELVW